MQSSEIRSRFLEFFKKRGHAVIPSASLVPENDPSVLFTTAGMQQFKPYYTGENDAGKDLGSLNAVSIQKCVRTSDIDEVGDATHLTFFEMLGNFSFGGYGRQEAITYAHDFITKELGLEISYVTFFKGSDNVPRDGESREIWHKLGVADIREDGADVFWGPTGDSGPCGPTTEIYCNNADGKNVEIWNIVFNEYFCDGSREALDKGKAKLTKLPTLGIDTGMGFERLLAMVQNKENIYDTDLLKPVIDLMTKAPNELKNKRIIADHLRASIFLVADGVTPSNTDRGYILRRLIRRAIMNTSDKKLDMQRISKFVDTLVAVYKDSYPELGPRATLVKKVLTEEASKFAEALFQGGKELEKEFNKWVRGPVSGYQDDKELVEKLEKEPKRMPGLVAFNIFTTYGLPIDLIVEMAKERGVEVDIEGFNLEFKKHQDLSRTGAEPKFKGGLADANDPMVVRYHTATHLLHQALRDVLGNEVGQKGSNITAERLRFDFSFSRKMTNEEKKKVEDIVNEKITAKLPMNNIVLPKAEAEKTGAMHFFGEKYGDEVSIYYIGEDLQSAYSKEFCGGPHVKNTSELAGPEGKWKFKIQKEEASSQGVRRIKAVLG